MYTAPKLQVCNQLHCPLMISSMQLDWVSESSLDTVGHGRVGWDGTGCVQTGQTLARLSRPNHSPLPVWTRGSRPDGLRGPAGEGGSGLRNVSEEAVIRVHPSSWMGTRSHSLTRHKAVCVCVRRVGVQGRGFDGEQAMTSLYPSTDH